MNRDSPLTNLIAVDLFAGAGGLTLGFEQSGIRVAVAVENDPWAAEAHRRNFPDCAVIEDDIRQITAPRILRAGNLRPGEVDLVIGGPPCQGFSYAGRREHNDPRNALTREFIRLVNSLRPKIFVMENVPGLSTMENGQLLNSLCEALGRSYNVTRPVKVLLAAEYGVPQNRRRLFVMGCRKDLNMSILYPPATHISPNDPNYQFDTSHSWRSSLEYSGDGYHYCPTVFDALGDLPDVDQEERLLTEDTVTYPPVEHISRYAKGMRSGRLDDNDMSKPRPDWDPSELTNCKRTVHEERIIGEFRSLPFGGQHPSRRKKLTPSSVSPTIRAGTKPDKGSRTALRPIHYAYPRVITVREAARLMSFPDWVVFHDTKWHGFRLVGSAVPPLLARAIGMRVGAILRRT